MTDSSEIILSQWQTCVELANSVSQRRDSMNNIMSTLNIAILTTTSAFWDTKSIAFCFIGIGASLVWILLIEHYKKLNNAKYEVILKLEEKLLSKPMSDEWDILCSQKKYREGTNLELYLPIPFIIVYIIMISIKLLELWQS